MIKSIKAPIWDQMQLFCKNISDHQIRFVAEFNTHLDEAVLKEAIAITVKNNPIALAGYTENKNEVLWNFSETDMQKIFSYHQSNEPDQLIKESLIQKLDTFAGPQIMITLVRSEKDTLIFNGDHTVSDAAGVKDFMYQLAENYSNLTYYKSTHQQTYVPYRSLKAISNKLGLKQKLTVLKTTLSNKKTAPTFTRSVDLNDIQNPGFMKHIINHSEFEKIKEFGKKHSATINDMLLAIFYSTLKKVIGNSNHTNRLTYSSDLRQYLDNYDILSNYSAIHNIDIDNSINDFVSLLKEIAALTKIRKQMKYDLADFPIMALLFKTFPYKKLKGIFHNEFTKIKEGKSVAAPSLTNIGIIEQKKIMFGNITPAKAYMLGTINHPGLLQIAVSTYNKEMTFSVGSYYSGENGIFIKNLINELKITINKEIL